MSTAVDTIAGDDVPGARRGPTDRGARGIDINAIEVVGHGNGAGRIGADQVALDQARRVDVNAVRQVAGDDVRGAGRGPADRGTRRVDTDAVSIGYSSGAGRIGADQVALDQARRADIDAVLVAGDHVTRACRGPPIVAPETST